MQLFVFLFMLSLKQHIWSTWALFFQSSIHDTEKLIPHEDKAPRTFKCLGVQADCFQVNKNLKATSRTCFC